MNESEEALLKQWSSSALAFYVACKACLRTGGMELEGAVEHSMKIYVSMTQRLEDRVDEKHLIQAVTVFLQAYVKQSSSEAYLSGKMSEESLLEESMLRGASAGLSIYDLQASRAVIAEVLEAFETEIKDLEVFRMPKAQPMAAMA